MEIKIDFNEDKIKEQIQKTLKAILDEIVQNHYLSNQESFEKEVRYIILKRYYPLTKTIISEQIDKIVKESIKGKMNYINDNIKEELKTVKLIEIKDIIKHLVVMELQKQQRRLYNISKKKCQVKK